MSRRPPLGARCRAAHCGLQRNRRGITKRGKGKNRCFQEAAVDAEAEEPSDHDTEHEAAGLAHHLDALVCIAKLGPVAEVREQAHQQCCVVTCRCLLKSLPTQHQTDEDQERGKHPTE